MAANAVLKSVPKPRSPASDRKAFPTASEKTPRARPPSLLQKSERRRLVHSAGGERSRLQLKPATSPKLSVEKYPMVQVSGAGPTETPIKEAAVRSSSSTSSSSQERPKAAKKESRRSNVTAAAAAFPLVPWSKRSKDPPKNSGGWSWQGEGTVGRVYLNVSIVVR
jgi:hypothetical protein